MEYTKLRATFGIIFGPSLDPNRVPIFIELRARSCRNYCQLPCNQQSERYERLDQNICGEIQNKNQNAIANRIESPLRAPSPDLLTIDMRPHQEPCTDLIVFDPQSSSLDAAPYTTTLALPLIQQQQQSANDNMRNVYTNRAPLTYDPISCYFSNTSQTIGNRPVPPYYNNHSTNFNPISELMEPVSVHTNYRPVSSTPMIKESARCISAPLPLRQNR